MDSIPRVIHFIWIQGDRPFGKGEWMSLMSALRNTRYQVRLHTDMTPADVKEYDPLSLRHSRYEVERHLMSHEIHGVKARVANLSDIWRIKLLHEHGGIYSDLDIIWLREVEWGLFDYRLVTAYERSNIKTVANAFIAAAPGHPQLAELLKILDDVFVGLAAKGVKDLRADPPRGLSKNHTLLWKTTGEFLKKHADNILPHRHFYKNGWRRIGRALRDLGVSLNPHVDLGAGSKSGGDWSAEINLTGITGFHYYAALYDYDQIAQLAHLKPHLAWIEEYAATFLKDDIHVKTVA